MVKWSRIAVLSLYRQLLKRGYQDLKYTDKDYYFHFVRTEFNKYKELKSPKERQHQLDKGYYYLENNKGKLI